MDNVFGGAALTSADVVDGGAGSDVLVIVCRSSASNDLANVTNFEFLAIDNGTSASVYIAPESLVAAGATLQVEFYGTGDATFNASAETDGTYVLYGGLGDDVLIGGANGDELWGDEGDDTISGGAGADVVYGSDGHDTIDLGAGADEFRGMTSWMRTVTSP
ncbi:MAG: hypothetical protein L3K52_18015 [Candidatus Thiothrix sulfatifontis]|nr:MAG: hypothetical protein L3K52_18015 [Candidatus Thiothrix sulfatifontis]